MLLKDCPVGSFVRLVSFQGRCASDMEGWNGNFEVKKDRNLVKYFLVGDGEMRVRIFNDPDFQFEIIEPFPSTSNTITLGEKTYKLKPYIKPRLKVIDGVTYEMEEI